MELLVKGFGSKIKDLGTDLVVRVDEVVMVKTVG
jgi:hypothetical protein